MGAKSGSAEARRRKLFQYADELGLDRDERIEVARALLWRDITSFSSLDEAQVDRLLDAFEGYILIQWTITNRGAPPSGDGSTLGPPRRRR